MTVNRLTISLNVVYYLNKQVNKRNSYPERRRDRPDEASATSGAG